MSETQLENGARLIDFAGPPATARRVAWADNFSVEWIAAGASAEVESRDESLALFLQAPGAVSGVYGRVPIPPRSVAILPPGRHDLRADAGGVAAVIATSRPDLPGADRPRDPRVAPLRPAFRRRRPLAAPEVHALEAIVHPADNPRLRFLQTATISVNLVAYDGPRGRRGLSPHSHAAFEQGTLAVEGDYVHHLRTPWGPDAEAWRDDQHLEAAAGTLLVIPPDLVHTTEGVREGRHVLVDIFAPPRRDFIAKGWMFNVQDYEDEAAGS